MERICCFPPPWVVFFLDYVPAVDFEKKCREERKCRQIKPLLLGYSKRGLRESIVVYLKKKKWKPLEMMGGWSERMDEMGGRLNVETFRRSGTHSLHLLLVYGSVSFLSGWKDFAFCSSFVLFFYHFHLKSHLPSVGFLSGTFSSSPSSCVSFSELGCGCCHGSRARASMCLSTRMLPPSQRLLFTDPPIAASAHVCRLDAASVHLDRWLIRLDLIYSLSSLLSNLFLWRSKTHII